jgi:hypothetical protein
VARPRVRRRTCRIRRDSDVRARHPTNSGRARGDGGRPAPPRRVVCSTGGVCTSMCPPLNAVQATTHRPLPGGRARTVPGTRKAADYSCILAGQRLRLVCVPSVCRGFAVSSSECRSLRPRCAARARQFGLWK